MVVLESALLLEGGSTPPVAPLLRADPIVRELNARRNNCERMPSEKREAGWSICRPDTPGGTFAGRRPLRNINDEASTLDGDSTDGLGNKNRITAPLLELEFERYSHIDDCVCVNEAASRCYSARRRTQRPRASLCNYNFTQERPRSKQQLSQHSCRLHHMGKGWLKYSASNLDPLLPFSPSSPSPLSPNGKGWRRQGPLS